MHDHYIPTLLLLVYYGYASVCVCVQEHVCGGQGPSPGAIPQELPTLCLKSDAVLGLQTHLDFPPLWFLCLFMVYVLVLECQEHPD